jgi:hypothetical protein
MYVPRKRPKNTGGGVWRAASLRPPHIRSHGFHLAMAFRDWWLPTGAIIYELRAGPGTGGLWFVLVLHIFSPPRGSSAAGAGPSWVGGARGMPSGEVLGENGPAAGALIGLTKRLNAPRAASPASKQRSASRAPPPPRPRPQVLPMPAVIDPSQPAARRTMPINTSPSQVIRST